MVCETEEIFLSDYQFLAKESTGTVAIKSHFRFTVLHYNFKSRQGLFGGLFLGRFFTITTLPGFLSQFKIGMEFMPTVRAAHEHSPDMCGDTKRLMTPFTIFDDVIFHRSYIGRGIVTIKQRVTTV